MASQSSTLAGTWAPEDRGERGIMRMPVEMMLKIFGLLDLQSALHLASVNNTIREILLQHQDTLVMDIMEAEMSPLHVLLQHIASKPLEDVNVCCGPCLRRRIYFKGKLISNGEDEGSDPDGKAQNPLQPVTLDQTHFRELIRTYFTVKDWEQAFPQYRFREAPPDCRALRPREAERLRNALYHWMSYASHFHWECPRPTRYLPIEGSYDIRCRKLRLLSNMELCELHDLWETVTAMVRQHICPSTEQVMRETDGKIPLHEAENLSFGSCHDLHYETNANAAIVDTFLKLSPADILRFATNRFAYSRDRIIREVRLAYPNILSDRQSLGHALQAVIGERRHAARREPGCLLFDVHCGVFESSGGILDYTPLDEEVRSTADSVDYRQKATGWAMGGRDARPPSHYHDQMQRGRLEP